MRKCPFSGCRASQLPDHIFACRKHWYAIPHNLRREIYAAYDQYMSRNIDLPELRKRQQAVLDRTPPGGNANA